MKKPTLEEEVDKSSKFAMDVFTFILFTIPHIPVYLCTSDILCGTSFCDVRGSVNKYEPLKQIYLKSISENEYRN